ncbi:MAG: hypothetical protein Q8R08_01580 [bacterium]|nr:hypothetical protein [bacterium]
MQDHNGDNDLIPDTLQASPKSSDETVRDEHEFGQVAERPPIEETQGKKPGLFKRLFGSKPKDYPDIHEKIREREQKEQEKNGTKPDAWAPLDLSRGSYKDPHLYKQNSQAVARHLREEFKSVLPRFSDRNEVAKRLAPKKGKGFSRSEFRKTVQDMKKEGKLSNMQARRMIGKFKAYK